MDKIHTEFLNNLHEIFYKQESEEFVKAEETCSVAIEYLIKKNLVLTSRGQREYVQFLVKRARMQDRIGQVSSAETCYSQALEIQNQSQVLTTADGLNTCVDLLMQRAEILIRLKRHTDAASEFSSAINMQYTYGLTWRKKWTILGKGRSLRLLKGRAHTLHLLNDLEGAERDYSEAIATQDEDEPMFDPNGIGRISLLRARASVFSGLGQWGNAERDLSEAIQLQDRYNLWLSVRCVTERIKLLCDRARIFTHNKNIAAANIDISNAIHLLTELSHFKTDAWHFIANNVQLAGESHPDALEVLYAPLLLAWLQHLSTSTTPIDPRGIFFRFFIQKYLTEAFKAARIDLLPRILSILHGRKLLETVLADLDEVAFDNSLSDEQRQMRNQIRKLRGTIETIRIRLARKYSEGPDDHDLPRTRKYQARVSADEERTQLDRADLDRLIEQLRALLLRNPEFSRIHAAMQITPQNLRDRLTVNEAIVVMAPFGNPVNDGTQGVVPAYALLKSVKGDGFAMFFPGLTAQSQRLLQERTLPGIAGARAVLREGGAFDMPVEHVATELPAIRPLDTYRDTTRTEFWDRLYNSLHDEGVPPEVLAAITTWHVAITGPLYMLPLAESAPEQVDCIVHTALPFFLRPDEPTGAEVPFALCVHAAADTERPIPAVFLEEALLRRLWGNVADARHCLNKEHSVRTAYFAAHGHHDERDPLGSHVLLPDANGRSVALEARHILRSRATPQQVVFSACLAGRSSSDAEGDSMGLASALMLRNTREVIGALVNVPDGAMCWFGVLLQWHVQQGHSLRVALRSTQQAFEKQAWPGEFLGFLDIHLPNAMSETLCDLQNMLRTQTDPRDIFTSFMQEILPSRTAFNPKHFVINDGGQTYNPAVALQQGVGLDELFNPLASNLAQHILTTFRSTPSIDYPETWRQLPFFVRIFGG